MNIAALWTTLALISSALSGSPSPAAQAVPEQVVALAEVKDLLSSGQRLQALAAKIEPGLLLPSPAQFAPSAVFRTMDPTSLLLDRPIQVVILAPPLHTEPVLVFSIRDEAAYLRGLMPNVRESRTEGDIHVYTETTGGFAGETAELPLAIGIVGDRAAMGRGLEQVRQVTAMVQNGSLKPGLLAEGGDACALIRLRALLKGLSAASQDPFDSLRKQLKSLELPAAIEGAARPQEAMAAEADIAERIAEEVEELTAALWLGSDDVRLTARAAPVGDSGVARYLASIPQEELDLLKYVPADSMFFTAAKLGDLQALLPGQGKPAGPPAAAGQGGGSPRPTPVETVTAVLAAEQAMLRVVGAERYADAAAARRLLEEPLPEEKAGAEQTTGFAGMTATMTRRRVETYKGCEIRESTLSFNPSPGALAAGIQSSAGLVQSAFRIGFGKELRTCWTVAGDTKLSATGPGALETLKAMIDGNVQSVSRSPRLAEALGGLPQKPAALAYVSLGDLMGWLLRGGAAMHLLPVPLPPIRFEPGPAIALAARVSDDRALEGGLRIPIGALTNIMDGFSAGIPAAPGGLGEPDSMRQPAPAGPIRP
jgi:hypothetical protein